MRWRNATLSGLAATAVVAILFRVTTLDIDLQSLAWDAGWPHAQRFPWKQLHDFGTLPGLLLTVAAIVAITGSFLSARFARWRFPALYVFTLTALGPGLMTNIFGKVLAGRPRPEEVIEFGGALTFLHPFDFGTPGRGFSFLCGHCSMGYLFLAFFFLLRSQRARWLAFIGSFTFGLLLGVARVVAGAHFPSDIILAGTLMFTLAALLAPIAQIQPGVWRQRRTLAVAAIGAAVVLLLAFSFSTPINRERRRTWTALAFSELRIEIDRGDVDVRIAADQREPLIITSVVRGFGFPGSDGESNVHREGAALIYRHRLTGFIWEVHVRVRATVSPNAPLKRIYATTGDGRVTTPSVPPHRARSDS